MTDIASTLQERENRYGVFAEHANITQRLKMVMYDTPKYSELENDQIEALDMIAHKIGRILNGDPNYADSWVDIAGYAKLVADRLEMRQPGIDHQARDLAHLEPAYRHDIGGAEA